MYELECMESKNKSEKHMSELFHIPISIYNIMRRITMRPRERHIVHITVSLSL